MLKIHSSDTHLLSIAENIDIDKISLGNQLRQNYIRTITELVDSIRKVGLLQPIVIRVNDEGHFEVVSGCRRYTACKTLGWKKITCNIIEANDKEAFETSLIENIQRSSLNPLEEAQAFKKYVWESGWGGISELASIIGRSHSYIIKHIMLLDLPADVVDFINKQKLEISSAQELFPIKDSSKQSELAEVIVNKQLSSKDVRHIVKDIKNQSDFATSNIEYDHHNKYKQDTRKIERSLNKSILILRIAMSRIGEIIDEYEDNWFVHESLIEEKNSIHNQIDILLKKKKRLIKIMSSNNRFHLTNQTITQ
jgi:ParB family transcriptional regulator, chromosome partitioning protein